MSTSQRRNLNEDRQNSGPAPGWEVDVQKRLFFDFAFNSGTQVLREPAPTRPFGLGARSVSSDSSAAEDDLVDSGTTIAPPSPPPGS